MKLLILAAALLAAAVAVPVWLPPVAKGVPVAVVATSAIRTINLARWQLH